jgi:hydroxypyruvate isomerase
MAVQQCLVLPIFWREDERSLDAFCAQVAEIGYAAIELMRPDDNVRAIVATAHRHGLAVASMVGHQSLPDGLNQPENHERIEQELRVSIDLAADLGIGGLICFSGNRNQGQSDYEGLVACAQGLRRIIPYAEAKGVNLNMELLNSKVNHPGYQCDRVDWGVTLCEMVGSPRAKLLFDIYHMQIMEGDLIRSIGKAVLHIGHFHTAGNPGRQDLDDAQELNYRGICAAIDAAGYGLYVGHEFTPKGDRMAALRAAYAACGGV